MCSLSEELPPQPQGARPTGVLGMFAATAPVCGLATTHAPTAFASHARAALCATRSRAAPHATPMRGGLVSMTGSCLQGARRADPRAPPPCHGWTEFHFVAPGQPRRPRCRARRVLMARAGLPRAQVWLRAVPVPPRPHRPCPAPRPWWTRIARAFNLCMVATVASASLSLLCVDARMAQRHGSPSLACDAANIRSGGSSIFSPCSPPALFPAVPLAHWGVSAAPDAPSGAQDNDGCASLAPPTAHFRAARPLFPTDDHAAADHMDGHHPPCHVGWVALASLSRQLHLRSRLDHAQCHRRPRECVGRAHQK